MSLNAWEWEDEDRASVGPVSSVGSFHPSGSECEVDEDLQVGAWAQESESDHQCSSRSSAGSVSAVNSDVPHVVPCTFVISLAFPVTAGRKGKYSKLVEKHRKQPKMDRPVARVRSYCHLEYFLLPDDREPKRVDIVVFSGLAKVFLDSRIKTVRPWPEGDKVWVSWTQTFNIKVTKELLKKINFHKITLRLWDTKEKIPKRVKYYRLKAAAALEDVGSSEEVKHLVLSQRRLSEQGIHVKEESHQEHLPGKPEKAGKGLKSVPAESETFSQSTEDCEKLLRTEDLATARCNISRPAIFLGGASSVEMKELTERLSFNSLSNLLEKQKFQMRQKELDWRKKSQKRRKKSRAEEESDSRMAGQGKQGAFSVQLAIMPLLAGRQVVVTRGRGRSANILDCFLTLETEVPIMTEEQKRDLNPLTIRIKCVSCLPTQPVCTSELEVPGSLPTCDCFEVNVLHRCKINSPRGVCTRPQACAARLCMPVYCQYQFHKTPVHRTEGQPHGTHVYFQDINVIFLGAMHPSDLREYLEGPPMLVEVHDRDRKSEEHSRKPTLLGEDPLDSCLNLQVHISPEETESNPFESQDKMWDPYGVARVSFADLLLGHKCLNLVAPVHGCEPRAPHRGRGGQGRKAVGLPGPRDGLPHGPMPSGHYLEASSLLRLRADVAVPLQAGPPAPDPTACEFGRVVFVFDSRKLSLLHGLLQDITTINARALGLDSHPFEDVEQILSAFKMRVKIQEKQDLDVLTGFHLLDGRVHLLILEGLADHGLRRLWEGHQSRAPTAELGRHKALHDSRLRFRRRLYADLEAVLQHVRLFRPLAQLVKQAGLYVRGAVPPLVFQALSRIHCICCYSTRLREVITRDLLPSSAMIKELSQEFGLPVSQEELTEGKLVAPPPAPNLEDFQHRSPTLTDEIQAHQEKYLRWRSTMLLKHEDRQHSLVQKNITGAYQVSKKPPKPAVKVIKISAPAKDAVHNYSIQTLNSTELARKELYRQMAKEPRKRFTYSQNYLSAMVEPQDSEEEERKAKRKSRQAWLTPTGFQVTGLHRVESTEHLGLPAIGAPAEVGLGERRCPGGARAGPLLTPCSPLRSGGKRRCLLTCWRQCCPGRGGAGTGATRTSSCTRSHRSSWSRPLLQPRSPEQAGERKAVALCPEQHGLARRS
ncbi:uncharacterized protein KIAA1257 homolog isoform X2 [Camelus ferus]|uniref:Uncharacterized protein KIAA1257 homolog isoform X2 n=1 Tax=Camelus ferus TaxID=419612 RepID=A0A8B8RCA3_CAMFR|nr:uncharacterized protein KIAA1257 homolog isoform X2 [Camelus ferus]XP_032314640.1 uncharacterized protein KIAA1257 homolog isoform X2 [Camelus ferus]